MFEDSSKRLRQIVNELRGLSRVWDYWDFIAGTGGSLVVEIIGLGVWAGPEHAKLRSLVRYQQDKGHLDMVWVEAVNYFAPQQPNPISDEACRMVAEALNNELNPPRWDAATEARNKWIYDQAMKGVAWGTIKNRLKTKPATWGRIDSVPGIKKAAKAYAKVKGLPLPPTRQPGRRSGEM